MPSPKKIPIAAAITHELHGHLLAESDATGKSENALIAEILEAHYSQSSAPVREVEVPNNEALERLITWVNNNSMLSRKELTKVAYGK